MITTNIKEIINTLYQHTNIDKNIIQILIQFNLINYIFEYSDTILKIAVSESIIEYHINKQVILINDYQHSLEYIFANYYNNNQQYIIEKPLKKFIYDNFIINKQNKQNIILAHYCYVKNTFHSIELLLEIDYQEFTKYNLINLTQTEYIQLKNCIDDFFLHSFANEIIQYNNSSFVSLEKGINNKTLKKLDKSSLYNDIIDQFILEQIKEFNNIVFENKDNIEIQNILQRMLTKEQIDNF